MFNETFNFFIENKLISSNKSGFKAGDSCIDQLLSITHESYMNLLMWDSKLEASSLKYQKHLIRCGMMVSSTTNSKRHIRKFTKPSGQFFKGMKTTRSPQRTSLYMEKYQCWSASRFHSWSFVVFGIH